MPYKSSTLFFFLSVIVALSGCREVFNNSVNNIEKETDEYEVLEKNIKKLNSINMHKGLIIYQNNIIPKKVSYTSYRDRKTLQIYKQFEFKSGVGESVEVYTRRSTEVLNPITSMKSLSKHWKNIKTYDFLWGKRRFYDSQYLPIQYRAAKIKNSNVTCIFFMSSGPESRRDHFGRPREFLTGYYCLYNYSPTIQTVEEIFDGFSIEGEGLKNELFSERKKDVSAIMYYKNSVKKVIKKITEISIFPLNISDKTENRGSLLSD